MVARASPADDARKLAEGGVAVTPEVTICGIATAVTLICWPGPRVPLAERNSPQLGRFIKRR